MHREICVQLTRACSGVVKNDIIDGNVSQYKRPSHTVKHNLKTKQANTP